METVNVGYTISASDWRKLKKNYKTAAAAFRAAIENAPKGKVGREPVAYKTTTISASDHARLREKFEKPTDAIKFALSLVD